MEGCSLGVVEAGLDSLRTEGVVGTEFAAVACEEKDCRRLVSRFLPYKCTCL